MGPTEFNNTCVNISHSEFICCLAINYFYWLMKPSIILHMLYGKCTGYYSYITDTTVLTLNPQHHH